MVGYRLNHKRSPWPWQSNQSEACLKANETPDSIDFRNNPPARSTIYFARISFETNKIPDTSLAFATALITSLSMT